MSPQDIAKDAIRVVRITNRKSAEGQLENAILLWFNEKDLSSIHTLAVAAQGILNSMCKARKMPGSQLEALIRAKSRSFQDAIRSPQNFYKHGDHKKSATNHVLGHEEMVILDCISMYQRLFDSLTPLMKLFAIRHSLFNPGVFPIKIETKGIKIEDLARFSRADFLKKVLPCLRGQVGSVHFST
jgi:hypothetical protein